MGDYDIETCLNRRCRAVLAVGQLPPFCDQACEDEYDRRAITRAAAWYRLRLLLQGAAGALLGAGR